MLASLCHGDLGPIKRLIEDPEVNEWVRSAALDALVDLYAEGQLNRENIIDYRKGLIGSVIDEIGWWACFQDTNGGDFSDTEPHEVEDDFWSTPVQTVVRPGAKIGRNDPCSCGSGRKYKKCCLGKDGLLH